MDNVRQFPDKKLIDEEAAAWLARLDADAPMGKEELASLSEWMSRSPRHREALNSLNRFWSNNVLTDLMVPVAKHEQSVLSLLSCKFFGFRTISIAAIAGLMVAVFAASGLFTRSYSETNGLYVTAVGQQKTLVLEDGSSIQLNTDSQLEVNYEEGYRNLRLLRGEAYFEVAKNPNRPFRVYAGAGRVQAVGTAFNVHIESTGLNVLVTEGRVALASLGESSRAMGETAQVAIDPFIKSESRELGILDAGHLGVLTLSEDLSSGFKELTANIEAVDETDLSRVHSWREGYLLFSGEPLEDVVAEIGRYTTMSIDIPNPALKEIQIGGRFKAGDMESMFAALETNFGIEVKRLNFNEVELEFAQ